MNLDGIVEIVELHHQEKGGAFFMLQVKVILTDNVTHLEQKMNEFLSGLETEAVKDIKVDTTTSTATIQYEVIEAWKNRICADCKYWDDGGEPSAVGGLCHECGRRTRFNCRACKCFKDIRG